jgi:hypothetical protein
MSNAESELLVRKAKEELARRKLIPFTAMFTNDYDPGWVHTEVAAHLEAFMEAVEKKLSPRLMIFLPPRTGKSQLVSRALPAFILGHHPTWEIICATHGQELADDLGRYVRSIVNAPAYKTLFPETIVATGSNAADRLDTTLRGGYRSVGRGGSLTGRGGHVIVLDDVIKDDTEADSLTIQEGLRRWYFTTARTRLAPGGGIIIIQTLWSLNDLPLFLIEQESEPGADKWCVYKYPAVATQDEPHRKKDEALHPARVSREELRRIEAGYRAAGLARWWNAMYQQAPVAETGNFFKRQWVHRYTVLPSNVNTYLGIDLAVSKAKHADETCIIPFHVDSQNNVYISPTVVHERLAPLDAVNRVLGTAKAHSALFIAADAGTIEIALEPLINIRMNEMKFWPRWHGIKRTQGKHIYAASLAGRMQQGKVFFPETADMDDKFIPELMGFIPGADNKHDNFIDALSNGLMMVDQIIAPSDPSPATSEETVPWSNDDRQARMPRRHHLNSLESLRRSQHALTSLRGVPYKAAPSRSETDQGISARFRRNFL